MCPLLKEHYLIGVCSCSLNITEDIIHLILKISPYLHIPIEGILIFHSTNTIRIVIVYLLWYVFLLYSILCLVLGMFQPGIFLAATL